MKKKLFSLLSMAILIMAVLGGCADGTEESSGDNSSKEPTYGGSVVVGIQQDFDSLDPHKATAAGTKEVLFNIFEGLVKSDENGDLICAVAGDYTVSEDGLVYTFTLRENVKFHNGNTVTAEDVKYSLERASGLLDGNALISSLSTLTSVDIIDAKTVQVTVGSANTELIYSFVAAIIPKGSGEDAKANPVGTGPFSFVSYIPQEGMTVAKNADYWQEGLPYLDEVTFKIVNSADTALFELQAGTIQVYAYLTDSQASTLKNSHQVLASASNMVQALFLNNAAKPLDNKLVRQAILYALDNEEINLFVGGGHGTLVSSAMLPTLPTYYVDLNDTYGTTDNAAKAKELLAQAGYPNGFDLEITIPSNYEFHMQTGEVIVEQLKAVGINAKIKSVEWATWLDEAYNGRNYQATITAITSDLTPGYLLNRFESDSSKNFINFANAQYDETYIKALNAMDLTEKANYYKQLQKILCDDAASAFIQAPANLTAIDKKLGGYLFYPVYVQDMSTVYYVK